jgi:hypothetical protein
MRFYVKRFFAVSREMQFHGKWNPPNLHAFSSIGIGQLNADKGVLGRNSVINLSAFSLYPKTHDQPVFQQPMQCGVEVDN